METVINIHAYAHVQPQRNAPIHPKTLSLTHTHSRLLGVSTEVGRSSYQDKFSKTSVVNERVQRRESVLNQRPSGGNADDVRRLLLSPITASPVILQILSNCTTPHGTIYASTLTDRC